MSTARTIWLVFTREFKARMMTKANVISMAIMLTLIAGGAITASYFINQESGPPTARIALDSATWELSPFLVSSAKQNGWELDLTPQTEDEARSILAGEVPGSVPLDAFVGGTFASPVVVVADPDDWIIQGIITGAIQNKAFNEAILSLGGDPDAISQALADAQPTIESPGISDEEKYGPEYGVSMVGLMLLLFVLITGGNMIAMGVVEEKTSRVVEILLATIKPTRLLAGKILGVGAYGLFQVATLGGAMVTALVTLGLTKDIEVNVGGTLALIILWFLLGYTVFALLFGAFASLVSRYEDIGAVTTPMTFLVLIPFYTALFLVPEQPDSGLVRILSQVPFLSPFMMTIRNALGTVPWWEMTLAVVITLATIPGLIWLAARLYQRGVLHTGGRLKVSEALKRTK
ncbi:MAG: ABC transporter permease [Demequinaceae bacterium]|nr:ABC transporter permease [Demequinaceae bacterium]